MLEFLKVILLGIVEGITEWLPISSTGHMILVEQFVKLNVSADPAGFLEMFRVVIQLRCDPGSRRSLFSEAVAVLQPEKRMDQKRYLDPLVQGAGSRTACSHHRTSL